MCLFRSSLRIDRNQINIIWCNRMRDRKTFSSIATLECAEVGNLDSSCFSFWIRTHLIPVLFFFNLLFISSVCLPDWLSSPSWCLFSFLVWWVYLPWVRLLKSIYSISFPFTFCCCYFYSTPYLLFDWIPAHFLLFLFSPTIRSTLVFLPFHYSFFTFFTPQLLLMMVFSFRRAPRTRQIYVM